MAILSGKIAVRVIVEESHRFIRRFFKEWGLSFMVGDSILFDTFSSEKRLERNLISMNIDVQQIKTIVISHDHWDHTGGLRWLLTQNSNVTVVLCRSFSQKIKDLVATFNVNCIEVGDALFQIEPGIFSTGEIHGLYNGSDISEQVLVVQQNERVSIITGCAHPGIINIIEKVQNMFQGRIDLIMGGFHMLNSTRDEIETVLEKIALTGVERLAPCHCTGVRAVRMFRKWFPDKFINTGDKTVICL